MYKYNPCGSTATIKTSVPKCLPIIGKGSALAESSRISAKRCDISYILGKPSTFPAVVPVRATPASVTTIAASRAVAQAANDPYSPDPKIRFAQYFPPPPLEYVVPSTIRVPSKEPLPSVVVCLPPRRFETTAETLERERKERAEANTM